MQTDLSSNWIQIKFTYGYNVSHELHVSISWIDIHRSLRRLLRANMQLFDLWSEANDGGAHSNMLHTKLENEK